MSNITDYNTMLNRSINKFLKEVIKVAGRNPETAKAAARALRFQVKAAAARSASRKQELQIPPYMIISITNTCNLNCKGCYSKAQSRNTGSELNSARLRSLIAEAAELGISFIFLAGGEPLTRPDILDITADFPDMIFPLFTNGLLIDEEILSRLQRQKNVIPILSIEGDRAETDLRRGDGIYSFLSETREKMKARDIFYGLSFTVTRTNFDTLTGETFIRGLIGSGSQLFFYVEYIPVKESTEEFVITPEQRAFLPAALDSLRAKLPGLFVSFPGDEEAFGGCLSAGRGFIHISAEGDLEPCPFAPYSDANITKLPLKEALRSELLGRIRENHSALSETSGGCALWNNREWVQSLL